MIICPKCGMTSYNKNDEIEKYCGNCHMFHEEMFRCRYCYIQFNSQIELNVHIRLRHRVVNDR